MEKRTLGQSGLEVSPLCLGGNVFGWTADEATSFQVLDAFVASGCNFIDTANVYSRWVPGHAGGESETIIGKWLKRSGKRGRVVIATKVGMDMGDGQKGLKKDAILKAADDSLRRLGVDTIDLYQSHTDDQESSLEERLEAYAALIKAGKVRAIGASNYSAVRLQDALATSSQRGLPRYECLQPLYNLYDRSDYEGALENTCVHNCLGVIPYFSLASGFLTGKYRSEADLAKSQRGERVKPYLNERGLRILAALDKVGKDYAVKPSSVALAWLMARPSITAPIASATSVEQLNDLLAAVRLKLDASAIRYLDDASA